MKKIFYRFGVLVCIVVFCCVFTVKAQAEASAELKEALIFLQNQNFETAVVSFQKILVAEPENFQARLGLAIALIGVDKFPEASREIAKLLARSPKDAKLLEMAGQTFRQQKRFVEAEKVLRRRLDLGNETTDIWALYGDVLDAQTNPAVASAAYENAVRLDPDSIDYRYALGSLYWKQIRFDDAVREFTEILRRKPNDPRASFNLGDIYLTSGETAKAIPFLETSVKAFPAEFDTRFALGRAFLSAGKFPAAIEQLEIAVKLRPEIAEGHYQLGLALQRSGRREEAKTAFKNARELQNAKRDAEAPPTIPKNNP